MLNYWNDHMLGLISSHNCQGVLPIQTIKEDDTHASCKSSLLAL